MEIQNADKKLPKWAWGLTAAMTLGLLLYTILRALNVPMTFDEIWSFRSYSSAPIKNILQFSYPTANNHPGNSLLMKLSSALFGSSPFALRIPNLLAHGLYIFFSFRLAQRLRSPFWILSLFFLLNFNPYLLDFFALARGYGLASAFTMGALYFLMAFREKPSLKYLIGNAALGGFAVFCNFSFLHFFLASGLGIALLIISHCDEWKIYGWAILLKMLVRISPIVIVSTLLFLYLRGPVAALIEAKELYYGGQTGFWTDTVSSIAHAWIYLIDYWRFDVSVLLKLLQAALIGMFAIFSIQMSRAPFDFRKSPGMIFFIMMLTVAATGTVQHFKADSPFIIYRTAIFLFPLFFLGFTFLAKNIAKIPGMRVIGIGVMTLGLGLTAFNNAFSWNLHYACEWPFDADTPEMLHDLKSEAGPLPPGKIVKLGISWEMRPSINFYHDYLNLTWLQKVDNKGCQPGNDFYYVLGKGGGCKLKTGKLPFGTNQGLILVKRYPQSGGSLWKNPHPENPSFPD